MKYPDLLEAQFDSYRLLEVIGTGTLGTVFEALQIRLNRRVAVKFISAEAARDFSMEEFRDEVFDLAALYHPNIAMVIDAGSVRGQPFLVTELVQGMTLLDYIESGEPDLQAAQGIGCQILEALAHAHSIGVLHLDLTPMHVLLAETGWVKLVDFRMSRPFVPSVAGVENTLPYLSPEELQMDTTVDCRADIYSTGKVLWHLVTGQVPPPHPEEELDVSGLPEAWRPLIAKAVRRDPEERFEDCDAMHEALMEIP